MTERDLQQIETAIGRPVSLAFRQFMLRPPPQLGDASELITDPETLIEVNRSPATAGWPSNQLYLGDNGCGDVYSIDFDDQNGAICLSGPHSGVESPEEPEYFEKVFESLPQFSDHLIRMRRGS